MIGCYKLTLAQSMVDSKAMLASGPLSVLECAAPNGKFSANGVRLWWGQQISDDGLVPITAVELGLACGCICPACGTQLVAKLRHRSPHFAHSPSERLCRYAPETVIHKLAKRALEKGGYLLVPAQEARHQGTTLRVRAERQLHIETARLEQWFHDIIPDVIASIRGRKLVVEVFVTHRCDADKIARIKARGLAAVEIDLRKVPRDAPEHVIEDAIRSTARRWWLHSPLAAKEGERLAAEALETQRRVKDERAARAAKIAALISRPAAPSAARAEAIGAAKRLRSEGHRNLIDIEIEGDACFGVARDLWQAVLFDNLVVARLRREDHEFDDLLFRSVTVRTSDCVTLLRERGLLAPQLSRSIDDQTATEIRAHYAGFRHPAAVIKSYLDRLAEAGALVAHEQSWSLSRQLREHWSRRHEAGKREASLRDRVHQLICRIPASERAGFDEDVWFRNPCRELGTPPLASVTNESKFQLLSRLLSRIEEAISRPDASWPPLLGLPVGGSIAAAEARERERAEQRRKKAEDEARVAAEGRRNACESAAMTIGLDGVEWSRSPDHDLNGRIPVDVAGESIAGWDLVWWRIRTIRAERIKAEEQATQHEKRKEQLRREAMARLPANQVDLFLRSHPRELKGRTPLEACADDIDMEVCLGLLKPPQKGRRRTGY
jgi:hypothetical protein